MVIVTLLDVRAYLGTSLNEADIGSCGLVVVGVVVGWETELAASLARSSTYE